MLSNKRQIFKKALIVIIITLLIFSLISFFATKIIYDNIFVRYDCNITDYPAELNSTISERETYKYYSGNNLLCGHLYKPKSNIKDALIVIAPGQNACSDSYLWQTKELLDLGWSVFAFDATGCCNSQGESSIGFSQELYDLNATLDFIKTKENFGFEDIILLGHSRGAYAACCALENNSNISAVVSISGVNSAMEATIGSATEHVGILAYGNYGFLWLYQSILFGPKTVNMRANEIIESSDVPVLLIHGIDDEKFPVDKYSIVSHIEKEGQNTKKIILDRQENTGHTNLLFDSDGTANNYLINQINDFLMEKIK